MDIAYVTAKVKGVTPPPPPPPTRSWLDGLIQWWNSLSLLHKSLLVLSVAGSFVVVYEVTSSE